ncbi:MAG: hypothetical protein JKY02_09310 [Flavobacteriaceae bacterium]|nr:hypothetical protein [Flavobacteriaceae bacterium]
MIISKGLQVFYKENSLPDKGGEDDDWFYLHFKFFSLKFPNPQFRKKIIHIHDIQHVLYHCDVSWKGEAFIAGWEIATGMWKRFPIGLMSVSAMGLGFLLFPKEVYRGYKTGLQCKGIVDLKIKKEVLLNLSIEELKCKIRKKKPVKMYLFQWTVFSFWILISEILLLFPLLILFLFYFFI